MQHHVLLSERHRAAVRLVPTLVTCRVSDQLLDMINFWDVSDVTPFFFQTKWNSDLVGVPLDGVFGAYLAPLFFFFLKEKVLC